MLHCLMHSMPPCHHIDTKKWRCMDLPSGVEHRQQLPVPFHHLDKNKYQRSESVHGECYYILYSYIMRQQSTVQHAIHHRVCIKMCTCAAQCSSFCECCQQHCHAGTLNWELKASSHRLCGVCVCVRAQANAECNGPTKPVRDVWHYGSALNGNYAVLSNSSSTLPINSVWRGKIQHFGLCVHSNASEFEAGISATHTLNHEVYYS